MRTIEYLDAVKAKLEISSDYGLQKPLGVGKSAVSNYRNGHHTFDQPVALRVAHILEIPPAKVLADMELERATVPELQEVWRQIARKVAVVAVVSVAASIGATPSPADAAVRTPSCVLCKIVREAFLAVLFAVLGVRFSAPAA